MLELLAAMVSWPALQRRGRIAAATIVQVSGSAPRPVGTTMLVSEGGEVLGSLSGGCVEGAVVESAREALDTGFPQRNCFCYTDRDAFAVGLTCGGTIEVHVQPLLPGELDGVSLPGCGTPNAVVRRLGTGHTRGPSIFFATGASALASDAGFAALAGMLADDAGNPPSAASVHAVSLRLQALAAGGGTSLLELGATGEWCELPAATLLVESRLPAPRFLIFGANDFGEAMIRQASLLGYEVTLCDPRPAFAAQARFAAAREVVTAWPHRYLRGEARAGRLDGRTVVCVLAHDPKFDIPLLEFALTLDVAYIGALGSRLSHAKRVDALLEQGVAPERLATLHSPIGLDLGAGTAAEVAVSIAAGVIAHRNGRSAQAQLSNGSGAIHATPPAAAIPEPVHA
ncbi:XdhC family protein [Specibacter cremeus]|uniref:XdhC family protein n=1 Tax=Specibacter cremeus TaxID=1629051 RepID=UPI000F79157A|nr:XdhC family protein [Specibacter cremeus]